MLLAPATYIDRVPARVPIPVADHGGRGKARHRNQEAVAADKQTHEAHRNSVKKKDDRYRSREYTCGHRLGNRLLGGGGAQIAGVRAEERVCVGMYHHVSQISSAPHGGMHCTLKSSPSRRFSTLFAEILLQSSPERNTFVFWPGCPLLKMREMRQMVVLVVAADKKHTRGQRVRVAGIQLWVPTKETGHRVEVGCVRGVGGHKLWCGLGVCACFHVHQTLGCFGW